MCKSAKMSECGRYRYELWRELDPRIIRPFAFLMLNPSTADHEKDDPTIRRCLGFARREGAGCVTVVNLFALRATNPRELWLCDDPVGPGNDDAIEAVCQNAHVVVCAWGAYDTRGRSDEVLGRLLGWGIDTRCLGLTKDESPRHPLYVRADAPLLPFHNLRPGMED